MDFVSENIDCGGENMAKIPVEAGKEYEIEIGSLGSSGEGVGRYDGFTDRKSVV